MSNKTQFILNSNSVSNHHLSLSHVGNRPQLQLDENQEEHTNVRNERQEVSTQLTQLLNRISKRSTIPVTMTDVQRMIEGNKKLKKIELFQYVSSIAERVQKNFLLINTLTGEDIAKAFNAASNRWEGSVGERIQAISDSLADLSEGLLKLTHHPKVMEDSKLYSLLEEKYLKNCCRESEFATVLMHVVNLKNAQAGAKPLSNETKEGLSRTMQEWMIQLAPSMHSTDETLAASTDMMFQELTRILEELKGNDKDRIPEAKQKQIIAVVRAAKARVHHLATMNTTIDKGFFREAESVFNNVLYAMGDLKTVAIEGVLKRHIETCMKIPPCLNFSADFVTALSSEAVNCPCLARYITLWQNFTTLVEHYLAALRDPSTDTETLNQKKALANNALKELTHYVESTKISVSQGGSDKIAVEAHNLQKLALYQRDPKAFPKNKIQKLPQLPPSLIPELLEKDALGNMITEGLGAAHQARALRPHFKALQQLYTRSEKNFTAEDFNTKQLLSTLFTKEIPISSLIECRLNGIKDQDIDLTLCDENIVQKRTLGQGGINIVQEVTMKDGRVFIFKPENSARSGLGILALAKEAYHGEVVLANHNIASHDVADFFGLGDRIVSAKVGICNGQLGFFMEKAPGDEVDGFLKIHTNAIVFKHDPNNPLEAKRLDKLDTQTFLSVNAQIMKQSYDLEWVDFLIGSGDRHRKNYFIHISQENNVTLKGIDNDMSFPEYRTGFTEITFTKSRYKSFILACENFIYNRTKRAYTQADFIEKLRTINGITCDPDKNSITIDLATVSPWIRSMVFKITGMHQLVPPRFIDKNLYDALMKLDNDQAAQNAYLNRIAPRLDEGTFASAKKRLISAIQYAKELHKKNRVITHWDTHKMQNTIFEQHEQDKEYPQDAAFEEQKFNLNENLDTRAHNNLYFRDFYNVAYNRLVTIHEDDEE